MRLDDFLSTVGVIKRRTVAKELVQNGMIDVNDKKAKAAYQVKVNDVIRVKGNQGICVEILDIPAGSVAKENRSKYYKELS
ncbi:MAG: S4 domain-containing protein, partial [Candidatus Zixiibacteriota bacterium]